MTNEEFAEKLRADNDAMLAKWLNSSSKPRALILSTFCLENYGDAEKPWWKPKGGAEYWLCTVQGEFNDMQLYNGFSELVAKHCTRDSSHYIEMMRDIRLISVEEAERLCIETEENYDPCRKTATATTLYVKRED